MRRLVGAALLAIPLGFTTMAGTAERSEPASEIAALFTETFVELWKAGDAEGLSRLWLEHGDWMNLVGSRKTVTGRSAIAGVWRVGLEGRDTAAKRELSIEVQSVRVFSPQLAQVDLEMRFGSEDTGLIHEAMVAVLERTAARWRIASARVARIPER